MRISDVRAVHPRTPADPPDWRSSLGQILVTVDTDVGVRGYGVGGGGPASIYVIDQVLKPLLLGEDPHDAERLWQTMYDATAMFGRSGLVIMAISGVDLALWDAWAKAEERSVARLLTSLAGDASAPATHIPAYSTGLPAAEAVKRGFRSLKVHFGRMSTDLAIALVAETRAAVGPDVELFSDAWCQWDLAGSLRAVEAFAPYNVGWLEEPLPSDDLEGYAELARRSPLPIAGGEHEYTLRDFRALADRRALSVWQPDVTWTGGMTQLRAIYALAKQEGVRVVPHRGSEVFGLHAIAALDPQPLAESGRPWVTWLEGQPPIVDGFVELPERPGFGVEPIGPAAVF